MNSMQIANYLDDFRSGRKISQDDFVSGIVSLRQFQRYRSGECEITYDKLEQFANRLGIPTKRLMYQFEKEQNMQNETVVSFYNAVTNYDKKTAKELKARIEKYTLIDDDHKLYFKQACILDNLFTGVIKKEDAFSQMAELINYPAALKQKFFTGVEILILTSMYEYENEDSQKKILKKLNEIFETEDNLMSGEFDTAYLVVLMKLSKIYGIQKNYPKVLQFCKLGIDHCLDYQQYYLLNYFYYYTALSFFRLQVFDQYEDALFKCYNVLQMESNKKKIEKFTKLIEADFHINLDGFIINYLKKKIV